MSCLFRRCFLPGPQSQKAALKLAGARCSEDAPRDSRGQSVKMASPTWFSLCVRAASPLHKKKASCYTCKATKWSISHAPAIESDETPPGLHVFPIREAHNPIQITRLLPRVTSKKWRAAAFHFRPGGMFLKEFAISLIENRCESCQGIPTLAPYLEP